MKYLVTAFLFFCAASSIIAREKKPDIAIIPEPVSIVMHGGKYALPQKVLILTDTPGTVKWVANYLRQSLSSIRSKVSITTISAKPAVALKLNRKIDTSIKPEGYRLTVSSNGIRVVANDGAGLFYGVQTLLQLLPKEVAGKTHIADIKSDLPLLEIKDHPRFAWRGLMFDVARHFFTTDDVKTFIDGMVRYKYNLLHLHLSDDQGWRLQIKSLPKLTEVGAWNVKKVGYFGTFSPPDSSEPRNYGGFYTQEDIKELVQYAKERFVNILPEIDVPGHSLAAIASYPELSCTPEAKNYKVSSGEPIMNWHGGTFSGIIDNTLCPANEKVYDFLDKVVTEVAALFPFDYIHMGGDECAKNFWEKSEAIKELMQRENLKTMHEVQSYFEKRLEKIVMSKGKKFIGWDEILEGELAQNAAVMSWRGMKGGIAAAKMKHEVVMSPATFAYLDYMQGDVAIEPRVYASLRLSKAYQFDPLPDSVDPVYIKGGQANLWTEQVYNMRHAQYMIWPRALAIAESLWSPKGTKNWEYFFSRTEKHFQRFDQAEIKYAPSVYEPIVDVRATPEKQLVVTLSTEIKNLDIYYTFDNSFPDKFYPKYQQPLVVPKDAATLKLITYSGKKVKGRLITLPIADLQKRASVKK